jgi:hypothetical protein
MAMYEQSPPKEATLQAFPYHGIGRVHLNRGDPELAVPFLERANAIFKAHPRERAGMEQAYASSLRSLAAALQALHREPARAKLLLREAKVIEAESAAL